MEHADDGGQAQGNGSAIVCAMVMPLAMATMTMTAAAMGGVWWHRDDDQPLWTSILRPISLSRHQDHAPHSHCPSTNNLKYE
jgi:hypothetical protein